ncbi:hypothetical protein HK101_000492 [Irineochytrium annulatum]|nr:hypothetical protein HK101_000492 [Irineochytrium annulatum]
MSTTATAAKTAGPSLPRPGSAPAATSSPPPATLTPTVTPIIGVPNTIKTATPPAHNPIPVPSCTPASYAKSPAAFPYVLGIVTPTLLNGVLRSAQMSIDPTRRNTYVATNSMWYGSVETVMTASNDGGVDSALAMFSETTGDEIDFLVDGWFPFTVWTAAFAGRTAATSATAGLGLDNKPIRVLQKPDTWSASRSSYLYPSPPLRMGLAIFPHALADLGPLVNLTSLTSSLTVTALNISCYTGAYPSDPFAPPTDPRSRDTLGAGPVGGLASALTTSSAVSAIGTGTAVPAASGGGASASNMTGIAVGVPVAVVVLLIITAVVIRLRHYRSGKPETKSPDGEASTAYPVDPSPAVVPGLPTQPRYLPPVSAFRSASLMAGSSVDAGASVGANVSEKAALAAEETRRAAARLKVAGVVRDVDPRAWSAGDVAGWLEDIGEGDAVGVFEGHGINGRLLLNLDAAALASGLGLHPNTVDRIMLNVRALRATAVAEGGSVVALSEPLADLDKDDAEAPPVYLGI